MLKERFQKYIKEQELCTQGDKVLLAVSGGVDSMVMLNLFINSKIPFSVAHCNFSLRSTESDDDEVLVRRTVEEANIEFFSVKFDTEGEIASRGDSLQVVARDLRYEWFDKLCDTFGFNKVAIAHNADDTVETFFINLIRGTGIKGLTGIPVKNDRKIRPIMFAKRSEILAYAKEHGVEYRNDSSNAETKYLRNKIRHKILPELSAISGDFIDTMGENIARLGEALQFIEGYIADIRHKAEVREGESKIIYMDLIAGYPSLEYILFSLMRSEGFKSGVISDIVSCYQKGMSGKQFFSTTHRALLDRGKVTISPRKEQSEPSEKPIKELVISTGEFTHKFNNLVIKGEIIDIESIPTLICPKNIAIFDAKAITFPLKVRYWRPGDTFSPLGMRGRKRVSNYLVDIKMDLDKKEQQTVVESAGEIIWLTGQRISSLAKVKLDTKEVVRITVEKIER